MPRLTTLITIGLGVIFAAGFLAMMLSAKGRRSCLLALRSLWLHKLRSGLSVLGIVIGTGAVISLMAFGEGSMQDALEDIKRMGATNIIIRSVKPPDDSAATSNRRIAIYGLTYADYARFQTVDAVKRLVPMRVFPQELRYLDRMHNGRTVATTADYAEVNQLEPARGRFLTEEDDDEMRNVAVLASGVADKLFPFEDPVGKTVRLGSNSLYKVVGVLKYRMPTGGSGGSQAAEVYDDDVYIPLKTCRVRYGEQIMVRKPGSFTREQVELSQVTLTVADTDKVRTTGDLVRDLIKEKHLNPDWAVTVPLDRLEEAERAKDRYTWLLVLIASISLFVGGIGIMNIMLATVTERTREIGVRRALGAKRRDITLQFLIEAVVQTALGGLAGVLIGLTAVFVIPFLAEYLLGAHLPAKINESSFFLSLSVAIGVGVLFGWYPARRAAMLDPIEALRHE